MPSRGGTAPRCSAGKAGEVTFADLWERAATYTVIVKTKVITTVRSVAGVGAVKAAELMTAAEIADNRRLSGLGTRQHQLLLASLGLSCAAIVASGEKTCGSRVELSGVRFERFHVRWGYGWSDRTRPGAALTRSA